MSKPTRTRPPLQPALGHFRWLRKPDANDQGGVIEINDTPYLLSPVCDGRGPLRTTIGWKLVKADGTTYDVYPGNPHWQCDCGDFTFNRDRAPRPESVSANIASP